MSNNGSNEGTPQVIAGSTAGASGGRDLGRQGELLVAINVAMLQLQVLAERLSGYVLELEGKGMSLPATRQVVETLAQIAMGWEVNVISAQ